MIRRAGRGDIPAMQAIRREVRENRLVSGTITDEECRTAIEETGRGWVAVAEGKTVGFCVADLVRSNIWALFVSPDHEGRGHGRELLREATRWLREQGTVTVWLTTDPGTRAEKVYLAAGWKPAGPAPHGEVRLELDLEEHRGTGRPAGTTGGH